MKVFEHQVVDHGIESSQYFQGCGVANTPYDAVFTGIGDDAHEAFDDALEMAAQSGWDVDGIENPYKEGEGEKVSKLAEAGEDGESYDEHHYHVSVRVRTLKAGDCKPGDEIEILDYDPQKGYQGSGRRYRVAEDEVIIGRVTAYCYKIGTNVKVDPRCSCRIVETITE